MQETNVKEFCNSKVRIVRRIVVGNEREKIIIYKKAHVAYVDATSAEIIDCVLGGVVCIPLSEIIEVRPYQEVSQ